MECNDISVFLSLPLSPSLSASLSLSLSLSFSLPLSVRVGRSGVRGAAPPDEAEFHLFARAEAHEGDEDVTNLGLLLPSPHSAKKEPSGKWQQL